MTKVAVRDGQLVVPTCPNCGCRLEKTPIGSYVHFRNSLSYYMQTDNSGCKCTYLDVIWIKQDTGTFLGNSTNSNSPNRNIPLW